MSKRLLIPILLFMLITVSTALAGDVVQFDYMFSIDQHLSAPSVVDISGAYLAVYEPFQDYLTQFSPEGLLRTRLHLSENITSLIRLDDGRYWMTDVESGVIWQLLPSDHQVSPVTELSSIARPIDCTRLPSGIAVLDASGVIVILGPSGSIERSIDLKGDNNERMEYPSSLAFDPLSNSFFVLDLTKSTIWKFAFDGRFIRTFGSFGGGAGEISRGGDLACVNNALLVSDRYQSRIAVFGTDGQFLDNIRMDSTAAGRLSIPSGLCVDISGIVYAASTETGAVHAFSIAVDYSSTVNLNVYPSFPEPFDTLSAENVSFVAQYFGPDSIQVAFDFELYLKGDSSKAILQATITATEDTVSNDINTVAARWTPQVTLESDTTYWWRTRVKWNDLSGDWSLMRSFYTSSLPGRFALHQNYPNPFNPSTTIAFEVPKDMRVQLEILNILGQKVTTLINEVIPKGEHSVVWNGTTDAGKTVATGPYFYRLSSTEFVRSRKMVVIK